MCTVIDFPKIFSDSKLKVMNLNTINTSPDYARTEMEDHEFMNVDHSGYGSCESCGQIIFSSEKTCPFCNSKHIDGLISPMSIARMLDNIRIDIMREETYALAA